MIQKSFLDFLYEKRSFIQSKIDKLTKSDKIMPEVSEIAKNHMLKDSGKIEELRNNLLNINNIIEKYLKIHTK